ncbi:MAG: hypothetical protein KVP17_000119 [Porospora cf. gigantea B]|uniref:uncharacterized protein n=1 Tax=Porospora cf. gigantea B TaxID=2853592 RepID=UPI003571E480|nr:MAG: hypothetical protein KVP17_000119 [Porospora cf. gigantea B]
MSKLVLVTGATGFVGSHVVSRLLMEGYRVRGTVRNRKKAEFLKELPKVQADARPLRRARIYNW